MKTELNLRTLHTANGQRHADARRGSVRALVDALRPRQWVKNLLLLAPLLFSHNIFALPTLGWSLAGFVLFCLMSSAVYLFNDVKDREADQQHPQKRSRPIAAGEVSVAVALGTACVLAIAAVAGSVFVDPRFALIVTAYGVMNILYSTWLKHQVILDVFVLAAGFVLRAVAGALAIDVVMSDWLLICTTLLALFMGLCKRRHECIALGTERAGHRYVLGQYNPKLLDMMIGIVTASTVMSYALYSVSPETVQKFGGKGMLLTVPFVLYGIFRYLYLVYQQGQGGDPTQNLLGDRATLVNVCLWALAVAVVIYRP